MSYAASGLVQTDRRTKKQPTVLTELMQFASFAWNSDPKSNMSGGRDGKAAEDMTREKTDGAMSARRQAQREWDWERYVSRRLDRCGLELSVD